MIARGFCRRFDGGEIDFRPAFGEYEDLGTACLSRLRGEFAFALWDGPNDTLFAARDRFGIKPLYYSQHGGTLYLASEIKALLAAGVDQVSLLDDTRTEYGPMSLHPED